MWRLERAACRDLTRAESDRLFFRQGRPSNRARAMCDGCTVREACLAETLAAEHRLPAAYRGGFRAGLTPSQRWQLERESVAV